LFVIFPPEMSRRREDAMDIEFALSQVDPTLRT
jgi:hypothetical protein